MYFRTDVDAAGGGGEYAVVIGFVSSFVLTALMRAEH
jgi:hypothetical protein